MKKGEVLNFHNFEFSLPKGALIVLSLVKIGLVLLVEILKIWKVNRKTGRQMDWETDDRQNVIKKANLSFQFWRRQQYFCVILHYAVIRNALFDKRFQIANLIILNTHICFRVTVNRESLITINYLHKFIAKFK